MTFAGHAASRAVSEVSEVSETASRAVALLGILTGALAVRLLAAGSDGVRSAPAGVAFATLLAIGCLASGSPLRRGSNGSNAAGAAIGLIGAAVLCVVPLVVHLRTPGGTLPTAELPPWAAVVTLVAVAEEAFLRGALWEAVDDASGRPGRPVAALAVSTVAFAVLHVPLYGVGSLPLDLAVGLFLGGLRLLSGGWRAPALAHTVADLAGWWLR